jgi:SAM-dependent methyltransferase
MLNVHPNELPPEFASDDVRLPESLVEYLIDEYSAPGAVVLDPFAGFGTVLAVAERLGRQGYGVEIDERRAVYAKTQLRSPERLISGDARELASLDLPDADLVLSSSPYMHRDDREDPLTGYSQPGRGYEAYIDDLAAVYRSAAALLEPAGRMVIEAANLRRDGAATTLAWDLTARLAEALDFEGETVICWDEYGYGYDHSYCLAFRQRTDSQDT